MTADNFLIEFCLTIYALRMTLTCVWPENSLVSQTSDFQVRFMYIL